MSFAHLAALIASGAPIPGIKDIPDNIAEGEPSVSKIEVKRKPWEKAPSATPPAEPQGEIVKVVEEGAGQNHDTLKAKGFKVAALPSTPNLLQRSDKEGVQAKGSNWGAASNSRMLKTRGITSLYLNNTYTYSAAVLIGTPPQRFNIYVDTGAADFVIGDSSCTQCGDGAKYNFTNSSTAVDQNRSASVRYGDGTSSTGTVTTDIFRIANSTIKAQSFMRCSSLSTQQAGLYLDGSMGMAYAGLSVSYAATPPFNAQAQGNGDYFALRLSNVEGYSELSFGSIDTARYSGSPKTFAVLGQVNGATTRYTYWQIGQSAPTVNGVAVKGINATHVLDSGTNFILAPPADAATFWAAVPGSARLSGSSTYYTYPCNSTVSVGFKFGARTASCETKYGVPYIRDVVWSISDAAFVGVLENSNQP
ncbi:hypothetical protein P7C70_g7508, partial [Phenoliferia sp. Uapishka_3]